jgi:hypothetical protein
VHGPIAQRADVVDSLAAAVDERASEHARILHRRRVHVWRRDIRIHDLEVALGQVARRGRRRDQMRPRVPLIHQRLDLHVRLQVE